MITRLYVWTSTGLTSLADRERVDRGGSSVETAVIVAGLAAAAVALVGAITASVKSLSGDLPG